MYYVSTVAGDGAKGYRDGSIFTPMFRNLGGITLDSQGTLLVVDFEHGCGVIRTISNDGTTVYKLAGNPDKITYKPVDGRGREAAFKSPMCIIALQSGDFLVSDC